MEATIPPASTEKEKKPWFFNVIACVVWIAALLVVNARAILLSYRGTSFGTYNTAGWHWMRGEDVYSHWMGFVYSPVVAAFFSASTWIPFVVGNILWQLLNGGILLAGVRAVLKANLFPGIDQRYSGIVYLLLVPLAIGNIDIGQANPLVAGLLLLAIAAVRAQRWNSAALCVAIATLFKLYPITVGLLICLIAPKRFGCRLLIAILVLLAAPFLLNHWSYVWNQYHEWIVTRMAENRQNWPIGKLPLDLWYILHWCCGLPIAPIVYRLIQLGTATILASFCVIQTRRGWAIHRVLTGLLCLSSVWMTLCGPATESFTYVLLAGPITLALVQAVNTSQPNWLRAWIFMAFVFQLLAVGRMSFFPHFKPFWALSVLPFSALMFLGYCIFWLFIDSLWRSAEGDQAEWLPKELSQQNRELTGLESLDS
jgi:Glycosyltransferase family 87